MIPLIDLTSSNKVEGEIKKAINSVIKSKTYVLGPKLESFERQFAKHIGVKYAVGVGSGTDALFLALKSLGIGNGDRVLTVSLTSSFTAIAILQAGAIPVFCDVDDKTWTIDINDAENKVDSKTKAIVPVHLFGNPCDIDKIKNFAKKYNLKVIEDSCQAHGAVYKDQKVGSFGDAAAFSFYPTKNLGAFGDGGMVTTNIKSVAHKISILRHGGQTKRFWHKFVGVNSRLDEIQAAVLIIKLKYLKKENETRKNKAEKYKKAFENLPIKSQFVLPNCESANHLFVISTKNRDQLKRFLHSRNIISDIYYPYMVSEQPAFNKYSSDLKNTQKVIGNLLALPLYLTLNKNDQLKIISAVKDFFKT